MKLKLLGLIFCLLAVKTVVATHFLNGVILAKPINEANDTISYEVTFKVNSICDGNAVQLPNTVDICIYEKSSGFIIKTLTINKSGVNTFSSCLNDCYQETTYKQIVLLPKNKGFIFLTNMCCRQSFRNLRNDQNGQPYIGIKAFTMLTPPNNLEFQDFIISDVISIKNNDQNSIKYNLELGNADSFSIKISKPFSGGDISNVIPSCNTTASFQPISNIDYGNGYSEFLPFGNQGFFELDLDKQQLNLLCKVNGTYLTSLSILYFKKGILSFQTQRDIIVIVEDKPKENIKVDLSAKTTLYPSSILNWEVCTKDILKTDLERNSTPSAFQKQATLNRNVMTYVDENVKFGNQYYYRLKVYTASDTFYSDTVKVTFFNKSIHDVVLDDFNISPNPSNQFFDISWQQSDIKTIEVLSSNGLSIVKYTTPHEKSFRLDASEWNSGIYLIKFTDQNGQTYHKRILKLD